MNIPNFMGLNGFVWFFGIVEDTQDPLKMGRVRVRCMGIHTENKNDIPTESLPWAYPVMPITEASMSGIGTTPTGIVKGTQVFGFFKDANSMQEPVVLGTVAGNYETKPDATFGFSDPDGIYPVESKLNDVNKLADATLEPSLHNFKKEIEVSVLTAGKVSNSGSKSNGNWSEQSSTYNAQYPYNKVKESRSGHVTEEDDTPNARRLLKMHRSGTFEEIHNDGTKVVKVLGKNYHITIEDENIAIGGNCNVTVEGDCNLLVKGDCNSNIEGDKTEYVSGNSIEVVSGNKILNVGGNINITSGGNLFTYGNTATHAGATTFVAGGATTTIQASSIQFAVGAAVTSSPIILGNASAVPIETPTPVSGSNSGQAITPTPTEISSKKNLEEDETIHL